MSHPPLHFLWISALTLQLTFNLSAEQSTAPTLSEVRTVLEKGNRPVKIVCFGDSVTGLYYHTGGRRTYTDMLGIALEQIHPKAAIHMINAGISGHTTANALARMEKDVLAEKPDLVTVMFGLNDVAKLPIESYRENLLEIVDRCRAAGICVVLCTPNAVITTPARPVEKLEKYCEVVREVAKTKDVALCDCYSHFVATRESDADTWRLTLSDEIHPNMAGHKAIAEQIAHTISGKATSLAEISPPPIAIPKTLTLLKERRPVNVLAMPPFDQMIEKAVQAIAPEADLTITTWPIDGMSRYQLRKDASHRVRKMKPDLVLVAIPRDATAETREEFIHEQTWVVNYSQSFGKQEWDVVSIHPSVADPDSPDPETDALIRIITAGQDISLIDRGPDDIRSAAEILSEWILSQSAAFQDSP